MPGAHPAFVLDVGGSVTDAELASLLDDVFVKPGHTSPPVAERLFAPDRVRTRGTLIAAREPETGVLLGMVILVAPGAAARQISRDDEAEFHLLAVHPDARGRGIGRALVGAGLQLARTRGWSRLVLSTQPQMAGAQALYAEAGFERAPDRDWGKYLAFTLQLEAA
ncbi:GNAT family N-acetyltransferase [Corallococcus exercitus]|uniref:GNAT family N-acetyltransferase n=1 Tax=Corallococcus exercitus TaxID=2316736 RepID=A0A7Y4KE07_9BACT|nr:GNAT family N-acetyltransferase [Corallococcus exercitus]NOK32042.1 GNAT family N-acetyltransferase [Corallococcus exercitus]